MKSDNHADNLVISIVRNFFDAIGLLAAEPCSSAPGEGEFFGPVEWAGIPKRAGTGNVPDAEEARLIREEDGARCPAGAALDSRMGPEGGSGWLWHRNPKAELLPHT